ncbi:MAG: acyltransferase family protein [Leptothrix sp. (in: b-proteobacteria)]
MTAALPAAQNHFDLLRLVLASGVMFSHGFELIDGDRHREPLSQWLGGRTIGEVCVITFFVLSGYLIHSSWQRDPDWRRFLVRRVARIVPGFAACSLVCALVVAPLATDAPDYWHQFAIGPYLFSLVNLHGPFVPAVFAGSHYAVVNGSMWTIRLEFRCYLWVLLLAACRLDRSALGWLACAVALGLASLAPDALALLRFKGDYWTTAPIAQLVPMLSAFTVGALFAFAPERVRRHAVWWLALPAWALLSWASPVAGELFLPAAVGGVLMALGHVGSATLAQLRPSWDLSYGVYLCAWPIQKLSLWVQPELGALALFAITWPLTLLAAAASWHAVERPAQRWAARWLSRRASTPEAVIGPVPQQRVS